MLKVAFVRGKYLNNFEGQNYIFDTDIINLSGVSSLTPIHSILPFPVFKLPSLADLPLPQKLTKYLSNRLIGDAQILFGLEKMSQNFDIFHSGDPHYYYSYQLARLRSRGFIKKLVMTSWETIPFNNESVKKKKFLKKFSQKWADHFLTYSEKAKKTLIMEGVKPDKIQVIRLGVDLTKFKTKKTPQKKDLTVLFVGRLVEEKGIMDLRKININAKLSIIAGGSLKNYDEMPEVYQKADIFIMPSRSTKTWEEQYGMVLVEALASGLPVVSYDTGAISEIIGDCGVLIKEGDIKGLNCAINRLVKDENLRTKMGYLSRKRAEKYFDSRKTSKQISDFYEKIYNNKL